VVTLQPDPNAQLNANSLSPTKRRRNARGQGGRLTEEIVAGALGLIEREGTDEAVTLRAVAREVGIAAPSIYPHFPDRAAIMLAVVARVFDELTETISRQVAAAGDDPVERLVAGCEGYVAFGLRRPARYRVLFSERRNGDEAWRDYCKPVTLESGESPVLEFGTESFSLLVDSLAACITSGRSASTDAFSDSTAIWVALHGTVSLKTATPGFPWPEPDEFVRKVVLLLGRITD
jgi:AcrR family transcriptional regulator